MKNGPLRPELKKRFEGPQRTVKCWDTGTLKMQTGWDTGTSKMWTCVDRQTQNRQTGERKKKEERKKEEK